MNSLFLVDVPAHKLWSRQLEKKAESSKKWGSRRSGDRLESERKDITTLTDGVAFTFFPFVRS